MHLPTFLPALGASLLLPALTSGKPLPQTKTNGTCDREGARRCNNIAEIDVCHKVNGQLWWVHLAWCPTGQVCIAPWKGGQGHCEDYAPLVDCWPFCSGEGEAGMVD